MLSETKEGKDKEKVEEKKELRIECLIRELFLARKPKRIVIVIDYE